jgi:hypothetical protein
MCPRCSAERDQRDGPYFVCADCRWRWTISITGTVYVQGSWAPGRPPAEEDMSRRLLKSVGGLDKRLADEPSPASAPGGELRALPGFRPTEIERLRTIRAAVEGAYYNEGVPLDQLRVHGVSLSSDEDDD